MRCFLRRGERHRPVLFVLVTTLVVWSAPLAGQRPLNAVGTQDLDFGSVFAGVPTSVPRTDRAQSGQMQVNGGRNLEVLIEFVLPGFMVNPVGDQMPLSFGSNDGGYSTRPSMVSMQGFDPRNPLVARLGNNGRLYLTLGGTVQPPISQPAGAYSATATLTISYTGN
jgi:hypothetical protein